MPVFDCSSCGGSGVQLKDPRIPLELKCSGCNGKGYIADLMRVELSGGDIYELPILEMKCDICGGDIPFDVHGSVITVNRCCEIKGFEHTGAVRFLKYRPNYRSKRKPKDWTRVDIPRGGISIPFWGEKEKVDERSSRTDI